MSAIVPLPPIGDVETIPADVLLQALAEANAERAERLATVQIGTTLAQGDLVVRRGDNATVRLGGPGAPIVTGRLVG